MLITGIIGYPLENTLSPRMHNAAFKRLRIDGIYLPLPIKEEELKDATIGLRALGFRGVNVTIPYKEKIMEYLDDVTEEAKKVGAVNIILIENHKLVGYNTDVYGFKESLMHYKIDIKDGNFLLIGAGGAARACAYVISSIRPKRFIITNRTFKRAKLVSNLFGAEVINIDKIGQVIPEMDIIINATSVDLQELILAKAGAGVIYYDINYKFRKLRRDVKIINGLFMLVVQGAYSFHLWTGKKPPIEVMKTIVGLK